MTEAEVRRTFEDLGEIDLVPERGRFLVTIVSKQFEGMSEFERQHLVWQRALDRLPGGSASIEFIYTYSPSEKAKLDRGEALDELID